MLVLKRVSFPKLGQILNKLAEEKGFVGEQGKQRKKTIAEKDRGQAKQKEFLEWPGIKESGWENSRI